MSPKKKTITGRWPMIVVWLRGRRDQMAAKPSGLRQGFGGPAGFLLTLVS